MKILIINQHPQDVVGGSEIQCDLLAQHLTLRGHAVIYFAVDGKQPEYNTSYPVIPGKLRSRDLQRTLREHPLDVAYWRFNKRKFLPTAFEIRRQGIKLVFAISHINDVIKWSHKVQQYDATTLTGKIAQHARSLRSILASRLNHLGFLLVNGVIAQLHQQTGHLPVKREVVIPNSVDARTVPFTWEKPFVLWASSLKTSKNPERFLELAAQFQQAPVDFLMVGHISNPRYERLVRDAQGLPNFHYLGVVSYHELNGMLRASLFLAHTCAPEGFPNVFIQAWMQAKPVVSLYYDPDDLLATHQLGYCSETFEQFVQDTQRLIDNIEDRNTIGIRVEAFARQHFDLASNAQKIEAFLKEICRK